MNRKRHRKRHGKRHGKRHRERHKQPKSSRASELVGRVENQKKTQNNDYMSLRNCPGRLSSFRRFGACCDDARHCKQNGVVFEANFFAKVIEVLHQRARALHGLGQLIRKSAPCAVRTDRRNGGHAIGYRRAAENCREPALLQGGARKRRYSRCNCI